MDLSLTSDTKNIVSLESCGGDGSRLPPTPLFPRRLNNQSSFVAGARVPFLEGTYM